MFIDVAPQEFYPSSTAAAATGGKSKYLNKLEGDTSVRHSNTVIR